MKKRAASPPTYLFIALVAKEEDGTELKVLHKMVGQVPSARVEGRFQTIHQLIDHLHIAAETGDSIEISLSVNGLKSGGFAESEGPWQPE